MTANKIAKFVLITTLTITGFSIASGQFSPTSAPAPGPTAEYCKVEILNFVENDSNLTVPDKRCCPEVKNQVIGHAAYLCQIIGLASNYNVNLSRALMLPMVCKFEIPLSSLCPISPTASTPGLITPAGLTPETQGIALSPAAKENNGASEGAVLSVFALTATLGFAILLPLFG